MNAILNHSVYGKIVYEESFWTGKKSLTLNGEPLTAVDKKTFYFNNEGKSVYVSLKGNYYTGLKLTVEGQEFTVVPPSKWYEFALSVLIFILIVIWGSNPWLCSIIPIVGGAIGGGISGVMLLVNLSVMKIVKKAWQKLLVWIGFTCATFFLCHVIALALLSAI
ncbi:MAG: hypothetical protein IJW13_04345 [Clostridia bacterium]|nr:hypothetical protein [Clostridia bacterium]